MSQAQPVQFDVDEAAAALLTTYRNDPLGYAEVMYPWGEPDTDLERMEFGSRQWQVDAWAMLGEHLQDPERATKVPFRFAVSSGHGIGKSAWFSITGQWATTTFPDAKGVITANTDDQLRTKTWPEFAKWWRMNACEHLFKLDGTSFHPFDKRMAKTWRYDALPWSATNPIAFQGLHNVGKRMFVFFDEGSGIDDTIYELIEDGPCMDDDTQVIWCVFGNPNKPQGAFYDCFHTQRHKWHHKQIDARDVPGTNKAELNAKAKEFGEDSDRTRVRIRGMFPRAGFNQLIPSHTIEDAQEQEDLAPRLSDPLIMGVDIAREGDDLSVIYTRKGRVAGVHMHDGTWRWSKLGNVDMAHRVAEKIREVGPHYVNIDGGGPGGGVIDVLREWGYEVNEIKFGGASSNEDYANKRAEMWCDMRDWLAGGPVSIPAWDTDLRNELLNQTYTYREGKNNDLVLTAKADMKRDGLPSPDHADALALTFAIPVMPVTDASRRLGDARKARTDYVGGWE